LEREAVEEPDYVDGAVFGMQSQSMVLNGIGLDVVGPACQLEKKENEKERRCKLYILSPYIQNACHICITCWSLNFRVLVHFSVQNGYALLYRLHGGLNLIDYKGHVDPALLLQLSSPI
jgi:hypothetical protein